METMQTHLKTVASRLCRNIAIQANKNIVAVAATILTFWSVSANAQTGFSSDLVQTQGAGADFVAKTYYTNDPGTSGVTEKFDGANLGKKFDRNAQNTDFLQLNATANILAAPGDNVQAVQLLYRVVRAEYTTQQYADPKYDYLRGDFIPLTLDYQSGDITGDIATGKSGKSTWQGKAFTPDLIKSISSPGDYVVQVYFAASVSSTSSSNGGTSTTNIVTDDNSKAYYNATFTITYSGSIYVTRTWQGNSSSNGNWSNPLNWAEGVAPNSNADVIIPIIDDNGNLITTNPVVLDGDNVSAHNLTLEASLDVDPANITLGVNSVLNIYGDFADAGANVSGISGVRQDPTSVVVLAGKDQTFNPGKGGADISNMVISNGGIKSVTNNIRIAKSFAFVGASYNPAGIVVPSIGNSIVLLDGAELTGETEGAFIRGLVGATRKVSSGPTNTNTFGGIGIALTVDDASIADQSVTVFRTYSVYNGPNKSVSIQRGFNFQNAPSIAKYTLSFYYLNDLLNSIPVANLRMFTSTTGRAPFTYLGVTSLDRTNKILTVSDIVLPLKATFTLGNSANPLPVTLASFTATGTAQGAALKWVTASELNNKGFGVERQVAGATTWESVGYVTGTNAANGSSYSFLDKTIPREATQVYYRLRQEDKTGELTYSPVAVISRAAAGADLTLSPVPLDSSPLLVSFAEAGQAGAVIDVINMQGQRVGHFASEGSADGVRLPLSHLAPGVYIVNVQVPGQATRHARFVKQ